jgi:hypothetical protein
MESEGYDYRAESLVFRSKMGLDDEEVEQRVSLI